MILTSGTLGTREDFDIALDIDIDLDLDLDLDLENHFTEWMDSYARSDAIVRNGIGTQIPGPVRKYTHHCFESGMGWRLEGDPPSHPPPPDMI